MIVFGPARRRVGESQNTLRGIGWRHDPAAALLPQSAKLLN